ncbi:MAG: poly-gamma-glutamate hydrolase family protein, partial [Ilumatobacteraceae bacterium]
MTAGLASLLAEGRAIEELELRSTFGFMAFHGGRLEVTTDRIARAAAEQAGASYYGVLHTDDDPTHV